MGSDGSTSPVYQALWRPYLRHVEGRLEFPPYLITGQLISWEKLEGCLGYRIVGPVHFPRASGSRIHDLFPLITQPPIKTISGNPDRIQPRSCSGFVVFSDRQVSVSGWWGIRGTDPLCDTGEDFSTKLAGASPKN